MSTPLLPLSELSKKSAVRPWASDIKAEMDRFADGKSGDIETAEYNLKLLGCVFKRAVHREHILVHNLVTKHIEREKHKAVSKALLAFEDDIRTALRRLRKVGERSNKKGVPTQLREAWRAVDEYTSLITEESLTELVVLVDSLSDVAPFEEALEKLKTLAIEQYSHRRANNYESYAIEGEANEYLPHRWRVLKRYISSALYLDVGREQSGQYVTRIVGMIAAGIAMFFATLALLFIQEHWATSLSTAFVTAMVISYIIKDQIKDLGKSTVGAYLSRMLPDHLITIYGAKKEKLGQCTENFEICRVDQLSSELLSLRYSDLESREAIDGRPETVLCYRKKIALQSAPLRQQFTGATGLTDILRLNVQAILARMDDKTETYRYIHPRTHEIMETDCARVYRVNVLIKLKGADGSTSLNRVRVVLDKSGIKRVESVSHDPNHTLPSTVPVEEPILPSLIRDQI